MQHLILGHERIEGFFAHGVYGEYAIHTALRHVNNSAWMTRQGQRIRTSGTVDELIITIPKGKT